MAKFNTDVPEIQAPSFLGYSKGISQPDPDKTIGMALAAVGNLFEQGVKYMDEQNKTNIENQVYAAVDQQREGYTGALEEAVGIPPEMRVSGIQPDPETRAEVQSSLLASSDKPAPVAVEGGLNKAANVNNASAYGAHPEAYYQGRLNMIAKDLRAQYPGYREHIDRTISRVTGGNPANEYLQLMQRRLNELAGANKDQTEKNLAFVRSHSNLPNSDVAAAAVQTGKWGTVELMRWANQEQKTKYDIDLRAAQRAELEGDDKARAKVAEKDIATIGNQIVQNSHVTMFDAMGKLGYGNLTQTIADLQSGVKTIDNVEKNKLLGSVTGHYNKLRARIQQVASVPDEKGRSLITDLGGMIEFNKHLDAVTAPVKFQIDAITNEQYGLAFESARAVKAMVNDATLHYFTQAPEGVRSFMINSTVLKNQAGEQAVNLLQDFIARSSLPEELHTVASDIVTRVITPGVARPITLKQAIEELQGLKLGKTEEQAAEREIYKIVMQIPGKILDPKVNDTIATGIINGSYGTGNKGVIFHFDKDKVDEKGNFIPGYETIFKGMTTSGITEKVYSMGQKDPRLWANYRIWAEDTHGQMFGRQIRDLNTLAVNPNIKFAYDSDNQRLQIVYEGSGAGVTASVDRRRNADLERRVQSINEGIASMVPIAQKEKVDPNAYVLNLFQAQGVDVSKGVGALMFKAVMSSKEPTPDKKEKK